jgi:hypothetical protein
MGKTSQVLFLHTFHVYQPHGEEDWYSLDPVLLEDSFPFGSEILGIDGNFNCIK